MRKTLLLVILAALVASPSLAQDESPADIVTVPTAATALWRAQISGLVLVSKMGLVPCGTDAETMIEEDLVGAVTLPSPATDFIVSGSVQVDYSGPDTCFRGVAVSSSGRLSPMSPNKMTIALEPLAPIMIE